jgi:hypothetical protein
MDGENLIFTGLSKALSQSTLQNDSRIDGGKLRAELYGARSRLPPIKQTKDFTH